MRPKNPTHGVRPKDHPEKDILFDRNMTLKSYVWQKDRKVPSPTGGVPQNLDETKSTAKERHAKVVEAEERKVKLD